MIRVISVSLSVIFLATSCLHDKDGVDIQETPSNVLIESLDVSYKFSGSSSRLGTEKVFAYSNLDSEREVTLSFENMGVETYGVCDTGDLFQLSFVSKALDAESNLVESETFSPNVILAEEEPDVITNNFFIPLGGTLELSVISSGETTCQYSGEFSLFLGLNNHSHEKCRSYASAYTSLQGVATSCVYDEEDNVLNCSIGDDISTLTKYDSKKDFVDEASGLGFITKKPVEDYVSNELMGSGTYGYDGERFTRFDQYRSMISTEEPVLTVIHDNYDEKGRPTSGLLNSTSEFGCVDVPIVIDYDDERRMLEVQYDNAENCSIVATTISKYDANGNLIERLADGSTVLQEPTIEDTTEICYL